MLNTERNTESMRRRVMAAFRAKYGTRRYAHADFEHGQWWITDNSSGVQWAVVDAEGPGTIAGFDFELVTSEDA